MTRIQFPFFLASISLVLCLVGQMSYGQDAWQKKIPVLDQEYMPVRVSADQMSPFFGSPVAGLGIYAMKNGSLNSVPFQFTQLTNEGTVYSSAFKKIKSNGDLEVFDAYDRLELMYADAGEKQCLESVESSWLETQTLDTPSALLIRPVQIQVLPTFAQKGNLNNQQSASRYICIAQTEVLPNLVAGKSNYVTYDPNLGQASSKAYFLTFDKDNPLIWNDFYYQGVNMEQKSGLPMGDSILDSLKINIEAGVFSKLTKIHLDNTNLSTDVLDVQHGPIYDSMFGLTKVKLAGATVFKMQVMVHFYPHHVEMKTRFKIPAVAKAIVISPQVDVSLDANNMWGSKIRTSWGPEEPLLVNGELDEQEKAFTQQEVNSKDSWIWYSTQRGFDLFTFIDFDKDFQVPIALVYDDDKTKEVQPERFIGQGPNVGYSIRGMVIGKYFTFNTNLLFSDEVKSKDVEAKVVALRRPWSFETTASVEGKELQASLR